MLDDDGLPADHVGGAVQQQRSRHAAGQRAVDGLVLVVEGVLHHHLRRDRAGRFVDVVVEREVRVGVDDAGREILSARVDHRGRGGCVDRFADRGDLAVFDVDAAVFQVAVRDGHDDRVLDDDIVVRGCGGLLGEDCLGSADRSQQQQPSQPCRVTTHWSSLGRRE